MIANNRIHVEPVSSWCMPPPVTNIRGTEKKNLNIDTFALNSVWGYLENSRKWYGYVTTLHLKFHKSGLQRNRFLSSNILSSLNISQSCNPEKNHPILLYFLDSYQHLPRCQTMPSFPGSSHDHHGTRFPTWPDQRRQRHCNQGDGIASPAETLTWNEML